MRDDRAALVPQHFDVLSQQLLRPTDHAQRLVESLSFSEARGQLWHRELQIVMPSIKSKSPFSGPYVVSLGLFERVRFPDFTVRSQDGTRLPLLTRLQHGYCLAMCLLSPHLTGLLPRLTQEIHDDSEIARLYHDLIERLIGVFTGAGPVRDSLKPATEISEQLAELLTKLERPTEQVTKSSGELSEYLVLLQRVTMYLCWVSAEPGTLVNLDVTYSMSDAPELGLRPREQRTSREKWADFRTRYYARTGLGPINYELRTPAHDHAGSYYLTVSPPKDTSVPWLDAGLEEATADIDCAKSSLHIHNGWRLESTATSDADGGEATDHAQPEPAPSAAKVATQKSVAEAQTEHRKATDPSDDESETPAASTDADTEDGEGHESRDSTAAKPAPPDAHAEREATSINDSTVHAFLQVEPVDTKKLVFGALLNVLLVYLVERGRLGNELGGVSATGLLLTPAALIAYIAQQERHYYSSETGGLRAIVWAYAALNVAYLVSISSDLTDSDGVLNRHGFTDDLFSTVMAIASLGVAALFALVGSSRQRIVVRVARRRLPKLKDAVRNPTDPPPSVLAFAAGARRYGDIVVVTILVLVVASSVLVATGEIHVSPAEGQHSNSEQGQATVCRYVSLMRKRYPLRVVRGRVRCARARRVMTDFLRVGAPKVAGWRCFYGQGSDIWSGTCIRGPQRRPSVLVRAYNPAD